MKFVVLTLALAVCLSAAPREVLSFYYGWYGNPTTSGKWVHWKDVDVAGKKIGGSTHFPAAGAYDTHDPKTVDQHCKQARKAGITGFIATWWRQGDFHDQGMSLLLDTAQKNKLKITIYYETVPQTGAAGDLLYILGKYGNHPAWLKVNNKPVLFIYGRAVGQIKLDGWQQVIAEVNQKHPGGAVFMGDRISEDAAKIFDGIHTYNITGRVAGMSLDQIRASAKENYPAAVKTAGDKICALTIIPGYDDTTLGRPGKRPTTDRHNGETYRVLWQEAIAAKPNWILITSFNEWHEGSEIEPSVENGDRELKTTAKFAPKFLSGK